MIEQTGKIVAVEPGVAWVQTLRESACSSCSARKGCGTAVLNKMSSGKSMQTLVVDTLDCQVGDDIVVGVPDDALLKASALVYLLPLVAMVLFALVADAIWATEEIYTIFSSFAGLALGFMGVRKLGQQSSIKDVTEPVMLRKVRCLHDSPQVLDVVHPNPS